MSSRCRYALLTLPIAVAGCSGPAQPSVDHAWVRLAAVPDGPAAAYFTLHGGPTDKVIIAVSADVAVRAEMHESMTAGGMAGMKPTPSVALPARTEVAFAPGGRHVMLFGMNPGIKPGKIVTLDLGFGDGSRLFAKADVVRAGDPAPKD